MPLLRKLSDLELMIRAKKGFQNFTLSGFKDVAASSEAELFEPDNVLQLAPRRNEMVYLYTDAGTTLFYNSAGGDASDLIFQMTSPAQKILLNLRTQFLKLSRPNAFFLFQGVFSERKFRFFDLLFYKSADVRNDSLRNRLVLRKTFLTEFNLKEDFPPFFSREEKDRALSGVRKAVRWKKEQDQFPGDVYGYVLVRKAGSSVTTPASFFEVR